MSDPQSPAPAEPASTSSARRGDPSAPVPGAESSGPKRTGGGPAPRAEKAPRRGPKPGESPTRIIAIANQKGGVGKSTTAVSLGAALSELGYTVLVVDLDPQGNASTGLGIRHEARDVTVYEVLASEAGIDKAIVSTALDRLFAVPSTIDLAGAEIELVSQFSRELRLRKALEPIREDRFDFILFDCPPSLGLLTVNALAAAYELIVPIQCEYYALEGLGQLLRNVRLVQQNVNPGLTLTGIVLTMFDSRTKLAEQVVDEVRRYFGERVYETVIPRTVRLSEAPGYGQPITVYDPKSRGAECYRALAREVVVKVPTGEPLPGFEDLPEVVPPRPPVPERTAAEPEFAPDRPTGGEPLGPRGSVSSPGSETSQEGAPKADMKAPSEATPEGSPDPTPVLVEGHAAEPHELAQQAAEAAEVRAPEEPAPSEEPEPAPSFQVAGSAGEERKPRWKLFHKGGDR